MRTWMVKGYWRKLPNGEQRWIPAHIVIRNTESEALGEEKEADDP